MEDPRRPPSSKKRRIGLLSAPMKEMVQRMLREKKERLLSRPPDPDVPGTSQESPGERPPPPPPPPRRSTYRHVHVVASLCMTATSYTLTDGVTSVTQTGSASAVVRDVLDRRVSKLCCSDRDTYERWKAARKEALQKRLPPAEADRMRRLEVLFLHPFPLKRCCFCPESPCSVWNASAGLSRLLRIPFDPRPHGPSPPATSSDVTSTSSTGRKEEQPEKKKENGRFPYTHQKTAAAVCIQKDGWTLCNGVTSFSYQGGLDYSLLARQVRDAGVRVLNATDVDTEKKWRDIQRSWPHLFEKLEVFVLPARGPSACLYCNAELCHRWRASVGFSLRYGREGRWIDPVEHEEEGPQSDPGTRKRPRGRPPTREQRTTHTNTHA